MKFTDDLSKVSLSPTELSYATLPVFGEKLKEWDIPIDRRVYKHGATCDRGGQWISTYVKGPSELLTQKWTEIS